MKKKQILNKKSGMGKVRDHDATKKKDMQMQLLRIILFFNANL